jgi:hypothetical protein
MKPEIPTHPDPALGKVLREWKPDAPLPPRFSEGVWKKIERADSAGATTLWNFLRIRIAETFARPAPALCYVALLLVVGLAAGYWQGRVGSQRAEEKFSAQYVHDVDPYQRSAH